MDALELIDKFYPRDNDLRRMLLVHSWQVCDKALTVAAHHPELALNRDLLLNGALVHDIGIFLTYAPSIHCLGEEHYLLHGYLGGQLLRKEGLPELASFCEHHTGAGLTKEDIVEQNLPLPEQDFLPVTPEEQVVCYADKFYSKSSLYHFKTFEEIYKGLQRFGQSGAERFKVWYERFE